MVLPTKEEYLLETAILPLNILGHLGMCLGIGSRFEKTCWIVNMLDCEYVLFATFNGMHLSDLFFSFSGRSSLVWNLDRQCLL